jgi:acetate---CoA ligase (ADP-forming)
VTDLGKLFNPRSIAVIGASTDTRKIRGRVLANVIHAGFKGEIYPVNPSSVEIQGLKAYPSVSALPRGVDLAVIALSAGQVVEALEECAAAGVGSAIVFASGFAEGGDAAGQQRITDLARRSGMRILGPNTVGFDNEDLGVAATFSPITTERLKDASARGDRNSAIDIVCQSGGLGFALASRAAAKGIHVRYTITTGNEADCETLEIVEHLLRQGGSRAILLFVEGFRNPERLERAASLAAQRAVPLLIAKMGRSAAGQRAAVSHTAHLTGSDVICDAVFERHGVIRVADPEEMMAMAAALTRLPFIAGNKIAIITTSGGTGGWAADILSAEGLSIPEPSAKLKTRLEELMPGFGSAANPVDVTASVVEDGGIGLAKVIGAVATSREYDAALVILSLVAPGRIATMRALLGPILESAAMPIIFHSPGIACRDNADELQQLKAVHLSLRDAAAALRGLVRYGGFQQRYKAFAPAQNDKAAGSPRPARNASSILGPPHLGRDGIRSLLKNYVIATPPEATVNSVDQAVDAADRIGFPLAMKIESADIPHKSDAGCVVLGVQDRQACAAAYARIMENARTCNGAAQVDGVLLQKMMPPGIEMVLGMITDPDFGPMIMLGFGGIYVEILRDSVVAPCPISHGDAHRMIGSLKGGDILKGARGQKPADIAALVETMVGVSQLVIDSDGTIAEADFNPVIVYPEGEGVSVVDYLFVQKEAAP